jgi:hypothetical protein
MEGLHYRTCSECGDPFYTKTKHTNQKSICAKCKNKKGITPGRPIGAMDCLSIAKLKEELRRKEDG